MVACAIDGGLSVWTQVTHLVIKRPQFFHFKPGDYVYINIPEIAKYEWHPFTISSAPEQSGTCRRLDEVGWVLSLDGRLILSCNCRLSVAPHPLHGPVDQPPLRVLQRTRDPDIQQQEAVGEPEEAAAAAEGPGPSHITHQTPCACFRDRTHMLACTNTLTWPVLVGGQVQLHKIP